MIAPYKQNFTVTQQYGYQGHRGIDLSAAWGVGDLTIICVQSGQCVHAGWDNGGYGFSVVIRDDLNRYWIYAHMSKVSVGLGRVNQGDTLGIEGNTGASKGIHLHLEARQGGWNRDNISLNVADILGIPNRCGLVNNTQNTVVNQNQAPAPAPAQTNTYNFKYIYSDKVKELQQILNSKGYNLVVDGLFGINTLNALRKYTIEINDSGALTKWTQEYLASKGYSVGVIDGIAGAQTNLQVDAIDKIIKARVKYRKETSLEKATELVPKVISGEAQIIKNQKFLDTQAIAAEFTLAKELIDGVFFNPIAESFENFINTGKFTFDEFAKNIKANIAKIVAQIAASKIVELLGTIFAGAIAGGLAKGGGFLSAIGSILPSFRSAARFDGVRPLGLGGGQKIDLVLRGTDLVGSINRTNSQISRVG